MQDKIGKIELEDMLSNLEMLENEIEILTEKHKNLTFCS